MHLQPAVSGSEQIGICQIGADIDFCFRHAGSEDFCRFCIFLLQIADKAGILRYGTADDDLFRGNGQFQIDQQPGELFDPGPKLFFRDATSEAFPGKPGTAVGVEKENELSISRKSSTLYEVKCAIIELPDNDWKEEKEMIFKVLVITLLILIVFNSAVTMLLFFGWLESQRKEK